MAFLVLLFSCEPRPNLYPYLKNPTVEFGVSRDGIVAYQDVYPKTDAFPDSIPVLLVGKPAAEPVIVSYAITTPLSASASATQPANYSILGSRNQLIIPEGRNVGYIRLIANKITVSRSFISFDLTLLSADKATVNACCTKRRYYINK